MRNSCTPIRLAALAGLAFLTLPAAAQPTQRAAFVANNGNVEGSVTSYTFSPTGEPRFVAKFITGGSGSPGTNAYAITLSPSGRTLVTTHATSSTSVERLTFVRVNADATLSPLATFTTDDSPLDAVWLSESVLAVTRTNVSLANSVIVYRFDETAVTLTEIDREDAGSFCAYLELSPDGRILYASDSTQNTLRSFLVGVDGTITPGVASFTGAYPLDPGITRDGRRLYAGSGISSSGNKVLGFTINSIDGSLASLPLSPYISPGSSPSPKLAVPSADGKYLFVGHGTSSVVRSFAIDAMTGDLTDTGFAFDVGIQGDLGDVAVLGDLLLVTDKYSTPNTGLYSFTIQPNGSFTPNGGLVSSQGTTPTYIAVWDPPAAGCYANCDQSSSPPILNVTDFVCFLNRFAAGDSYANCDASTIAPVLNVNDFVCFGSSFAAGCH